MRARALKAKIRDRVSDVRRHLIALRTAMAGAQAVDAVAAKTGLTAADTQVSRQAAIGGFTGDTTELVKAAMALDAKRFDPETGLVWTPQFRDIESLWRMSERVGASFALDDLFKATGTAAK